MGGDGEVITITKVPHVEKLLSPTVKAPAYMVFSGFEPAKVELNNYNHYCPLKSINNSLKHA